MRKPIVKDNEIDFEYTEYLSPTEYRWYKGEIFTGTLLLDDGKSYTEYQNGCAHGKCVSYYDNGQLHLDRIFDNGRCIVSEEWHEDGRLKEKDKRVYDKDGRLMRINESWLYPNGQKINVYHAHEDCYFSAQGELAIKKPKDRADTYVYYDAVLSECFLELIANYYPDEYDFSRFEAESYIWAWAMKKYSIDRDNGVEIYTKLANCGNKPISEMASYLLKKLTDGDFTPDQYLEHQHIYIE